MDSVKLVPLLVGLLIAVVMVGAVFVPVISSSTSRTITTEIENEGAEWLKLGYNQGTDYTFTVGFDGEDNFTVGTQTGEYENLICYADNQRTLFVSGDYWYLLTNGETPSVHKFNENASVTNASGTLTILDGSDTIYTGASPTWAYVPDANGVYGFFTEGGLNLEEGKPTVAVGSYAGVFAYNDTVVGPWDYVMDLTMSGNYADGEVTWIIPPSELDTLSALPTDTLEPAVLDLEPISIQPIDLGGSGSVGLMAVAPGTYTDGDWTYNISGNYAIIVSYTGTGADYISTPVTVTNDGTSYDGLKIGKGNNSQTSPILENNQLNPGAVVEINGTTLGGGALNSITNMGSIKLVNLSSAFGGALSGCTNVGGCLFLPNFTRGNVNSFNNTGFDSLVLGKTLLSADPTTFAQTPIKEVLDLGNNNLTTTSYGLNADSVQDYVSPLGYIAPILISETEVVPIDSPVAGLMQMLPLIAGVGALLLAVGTMIYTRF